jgi:ABC-type taurine transport system ATPase subunit
MAGSTANRRGPDRGIVFQHFALFPWKTVGANVLYGLEQLNPANKDAAMEIFSKIIKALKKIFGYKYTKRDTYQDPNMMPNLKALQRTIDIQQSLGFLKRKFDVSKHVDLSYIKGAAARLKSDFAIAFGGQRTTSRRPF